MHKPTTRQAQAQDLPSPRARAFRHLAQAGADRRDAAMWRKAYYASNLGHEIGYEFNALAKIAQARNHLILATYFCGSTWTRERLP